MIWQRCPQQCWKTRLRKTSVGIWRTADAASGNAVSRSLRRRSERERKESGASRVAHRPGLERQSIEAVTEPPGGTARVPRTGANRLTGPDAGTDVRVMKAGFFGSHRSRRPARCDEHHDAVALTVRWHARCSAKHHCGRQVSSVTAIAQNHPTNDAVSVGLVETPAPFAFGINQTG